MIDHDGILRISSNQGLKTKPNLNNKLHQRKIKSGLLSKFLQGSCESIPDELNIEILQAGLVEMSQEKYLSMLKI